MSEYFKHNDRERPHQEMRNRLLVGHDPPKAEGEVICWARLGGVLWHYERWRAARNGAVRSICTPLGSEFQAPGSCFYRQDHFCIRRARDDSRELNSAHRLVSICPYNIQANRE